MTFIFISSDALDQLFRARATALRDSSTAVNQNTGTVAPIRRPYRGIQIKEDTYATMSIVDGQGRPIPLVSESYTGYERPEGGRGLVNTYADFIIQEITEQRVEKSQIIETFGDSFVFFFGERPRILTIRGMLVNTEDFGWRAQFMYNYENYLRGTKLVQRNARMFLQWDTVVIEGYPIQVDASENSTNPHMVNFQMQIFETNYEDFGRIGVIDFPEEAAGVQDFDALNRDLDSREAPISTTLEVRRLNFESARTTGSLGSYIREGIKRVNNITSVASNFAEATSSLLSGRVIRKPIGYAGFFAQVGQGGIPAPGFDSQLASEFAAAGITDVKLRVMRKPRFQPVDESRLRTRISENYDEYPLAESADIRHVMTVAEEMAQRERISIALLRQQQQAAELVMLHNLAQTEGKIMENIEDVIRFTKTGFAMVNTVRAAVNDPVNVTLDVLGLSGIENLI